MSWAESREAGPEAGQGRGKLVSYDWLKKSSPGLLVFDRRGLKVSSHLVYSKSHIFSIFNYGFSKAAGPMLKTKEKN